MKMPMQKTKTMAFRIPTGLSEEFAAACASKYEKMTAVIVRLMREYAFESSGEAAKYSAALRKMEQHKKVQRPKTAIETVFELMDLSKIPPSVQDWLSKYDDSHGNMHKLLDDINADVEFGIDHSEDLLTFMGLIVEANKK